MVRCACGEHILKSPIYSDLKQQIYERSLDTDLSECVANVFLTKSHTRALTCQNVCRSLSDGSLLDTLEVGEGALGGGGGGEEEGGVGGVAGGADKEGLVEMAGNSGSKKSWDHMAAGVCVCVCVCVCGRVWLCVLRAYESMYISQIGVCVCARARARARIRVHIHIHIHISVQRERE
jgi:hypothetical protein